MAVTVNQYGAARRGGVHADNLVGGRGAVGHHVATFGVKDAGDILFRFFVRAGVVKQRTQFGNGNRHVWLHGIRAEEVIEDAADRAFLESGTAHVAWRTEGVFAFANIFEQRFGQRRQNGIDVFIGILANFSRDIGGGAQRVLEEANLHAQIVEAHVEGGVAVSESVNGHVLVHRADLFTQLEIVFIPVEDHAAQTGVVFNQLQQVFAVIWVNNLEVQAFQGAVKLTDRLFFKVDAHVIHDSNNVHSHSHVSR